MTNKIIILLCLILLLASEASAGNIGFTAAISQGDFRNLGKELGVALAFKNTAPPHPLGITGFDAGVEISFADIKNESSFWKEAFNQDAPSFLVLPKLRARKGLPFGIDIGVMYSNVGNTNIQLFGVEVAKAILEGSAVTPALGVRTTYSRLFGVKDLDLQTVGFDATLGKGFLFLTPYVGAGYLWINSKATGNLQNLASSAGSITGGKPLDSESIWQPRVFAGLEIKPMPLVRIVGEVEYALRPIYSIKAAIGF